MNIAFGLALHDYSASIDVGFNAPVRSDGQTVSFRVDGAFHLAIYIKVFAARELPFNHNRLADAGHFPAGSIPRFERFPECRPWDTQNPRLLPPGKIPPPPTPF